jgi:thiamine monophosphate kinase
MTTSSTTVYGGEAYALVFTFDDDDRPRMWLEVL